MQALRLTSLVSRFAQHRSVGQLRGFQPALRVPTQDSAFPDFTYRALLVDAAGTLLVPSEPAAEVWWLSTAESYELTADLLMS